jgi:alpha-L-fucosidase
MEKSGKSIYDTEVCQPRRSNYASFTRQGNTLYMHVHFWPGDTVALAGLMNKVQSARLLASGKNVQFEQEKFRVRFVGLPEKASEEPVTTIAIECDGEPRQDTDFVRKERPRTVA